MELQEINTRFNIQNLNISKFKVSNKDKLIQSKCNLVETHLKKILLDEYKNISFIETNTIISDLIVLDISRNFMNSIEQIILKYAEHIFPQFSDLIESKPDSETFLKAFNKYWDHLTNKFLLIRKLFSRLEDKFYASIVEENLWKNFLINFKCLLSQDQLSFLISNVIYLIRQIREDYYLGVNLERETQNYEMNIQLYKFNEIDKRYLDEKDRSRMIKCSNQLHKIITFFNETELYKDYLEKNILQSTEDFYCNISNKDNLLSNSIVTHLILINNSLYLEKEIFNNFISSSTCGVNRELILKILIGNQKELLLSNIFKIDIEQYKTLDASVINDKLFLTNYSLSLFNYLYSLFVEINEKQLFLEAWILYINQVILRIYQGNIFSNHMIEIVILFKRNIDSCLELAFEKNEKYKNAIKEAFYSSMNNKPHFIAESFSSYIDYIFTKEKISNLENKINEFIYIFKFLEAKDMFEKYYIKKLSFRLLYQTTTSEDFEVQLIEKFKSLCGSGFVSKAEEIVNDLRNSRELNTNFNSKYKSSLNNLIDIKICSDASWPIKNPIKCKLSKLLDDYFHNFVIYYRTIMPGRSLNWDLVHSQVELDFNNKTKNSKIHLLLNGVQTAILLLFNGGGIISIDKSLIVKELDGMDTKIIDHQLETITKAGLLSKYIKHSTEHFSIKYDLFESNNMPKLINLLSFDQDKQEIITELEERAIEDRKPVIDCLIMKTLKLRKEMNETNLIQEVINACKFNCNHELVTSRISYLITNDYIGFDENSNIINYFT